MLCSCEDFGPQMSKLGTLNDEFCKFLFLVDGYDALERYLVKLFFLLDAPALLRPYYPDLFC